MADYTLYYWPVPFRGHFIRAILMYAGKSWDEPDDVAAVMERAPAQQPVPFMGPPVLIETRTGFTLSEMPAIAFYLGETLDLLPGDAQGRAMTLKVVTDANDVIDDITNDGGREMWTPDTWAAYRPRLRRWMQMFDVVGRRHGLTHDHGFLLGDRPGIADIVTATLWWTMGDRFPPIAEMLRRETPVLAGLVARLMASKPLSDLIAYTHDQFGRAYCGGQIEASLRKVIG